MSRIEKFVVAAFLAAVAIASIGVGVVILVLVAAVYGFVCGVTGVSSSSGFGILVPVMAFALAVAGVFLVDRRTQFVEMAAEKIILKMRRKK